MKRFFAALCTAGTVAALAAPGDKLVKLARDGDAVDPGYIHRDVVGLLAAMDVSPRLRERFDRTGEWNVRRLMPGEQLDSVSDVIVVARGNAYIKSVGRAIVIAANDVEIDEGGDVVVVAGGNIRFRQGRLTPWGGVFVARGGFDAPWLSHAAVHAARNATLSHASLDVMFYNTPWARTAIYGLEQRSGPPLFDGVAWRLPAGVTRTPAGADFQFAGERCEPGVPMQDIRNRIPAMATQKLPCKAIDDMIVTCDAKKSEELWTVHGCTNWFAEVVARRRGDVVEIAFAPPPGPHGSQSIRVEPAPPAPGTCAPDDASPRCSLARIAAGGSFTDSEKPVSCPEPVAATSNRVDQLQRIWSKSPGGGRSKAGGAEAASFFELVQAARILGIDWSGIAATAYDHEAFLVRVFRDAAGTPGALVKELRVSAQPKPVVDVKYPPPRGRVYLFRADTAPIDLAAGRYWLSVLEPIDSAMQFIWTVERDSAGPCGSGSASRKTEREPWASLYSGLAPRRTRGYSFALELHAPPR